MKISTKVIKLEKMETLAELQKVIPTSKQSKRVVTKINAV